MCIIERKDLAKMEALPSWFLAMGFTMKVEAPVDTLEECVFCQAQPVLVGGAYRMVRDPRVALAKDCCSFLPLHQGEAARRYLGTLGDCGMALNRGVPVCQAFFESFVRASEGKRMGECPAMESGMQMLSRGMAVGFARITPLTRVSFWKAFGICPDQQVALEAYHGEWTFSDHVSRRVNTADPGYPLQW